MRLCKRSRFVHESAGKLGHGGLQDLHKDEPDSCAVHASIFVEHYCTTSVAQWLECAHTPEWSGGALCLREYPTLEGDVTTTSDVCAEAFGGTWSCAARQACAGATAYPDQEASSPRESACGDATGFSSEH